jgi:hypothetical protein
MPRNNKNKQNKTKKSTTGGGGGGGRMVNISGPGGFRLDFPIPRLPRWIGTPNLGAGVAVYPRVNLDIPISPAPVAVAAGAIAGVVNIDTSLVRAWATRFQTLFREFAIVGVRFEIRVTSTAAGQGLVLVFVDETSNAAPTAAALDFAHVEVPLVASNVDSAGSLHKLEWVAKSFADLTWVSTATAGTVAYLKVFASNADTGTAAGTAANIMITGAIAVAFRGYV